MAAFPSFFANLYYKPRQLDGACATIRHITPQTSGLQDGLGGRSSGERCLTGVRRLGSRWKTQVRLAVARHRVPSAKIPRRMRGHDNDNDNNNYLDSERSFVRSVFPAIVVLSVDMVRYMQMRSHPKTWWVCRVPSGHRSLTHGDAVKGLCPPAPPTLGRCLPRARGSLESDLSTLCPPQPRPRSPPQFDRALSFALRLLCRVLRLCLCLLSPSL